MMAKFGAIYLSFDELKEGIETLNQISSILVDGGYLFPVRYHQETPWLQLYVDEPENVVELAMKVSKIFLDKRVIGLAAYTVSDSVSFCEFKAGKAIRLLQSGFSQERRWDLIEGKKQGWEPIIFDTIRMEIGQRGMVSSHINKLTLSPLIADAI
ncbi:MAG: hypothetical protein AAGF26_20550 [Cyanobacteria bacterium P01_G01_bin.49]